MILNLGHRLSYFKLFLLIFVILLVSLFPDIDMKKSKIRNFLALSISFLIAFLYMLFFNKKWYYGPAFFLVIYFLLKYLPTKHRGLTHKFLFSVLFSLFFSYFLSYVLDLGLIEKNYAINFYIWFSIIFLSYNLHLIVDRIEG